MNEARPIAVIGSGVVGSATGAGLAAKGHRVVFCDVDPARVALLEARGFDAIPVSALAATDPAAYLICVPSPTVDGRVDISYVREAALAVGTAMSGQPGRPLVVVRSTVPPGTTEQLVIPALEWSSGKCAGTDFGVCMNPEFLRAASAERDFLEPHVIVIGCYDHASARKLASIYEPWADVPVHVVSLRTAEVTKYVSNLFNATKISFFNEMYRFLEVLGADADAAFAAVTMSAEGMWNPAYGTKGGAPYGGVCLPKDTEGLLGFAQDEGLAHLLPLLRATIQVNAELSSDPETERGRSATEPRERVR